MPTYQVKCRKCNKVFAELARIADRSKIKCKCGGTTEVWFGGVASVNLKTTMYGRENKPLVLEHLAKDESVVYVTSKSQLKRELKKHEGISPILD